jgi:hypothetical protein
MKKLFFALVYVCAFSTAAFGQAGAFSAPSAGTGGVTGSPIPFATTQLLNAYSGWIGMYWPTAGSGTTLADSSGKSNNATFNNCGGGGANPTWASPIGLTFVRASFECVQLPAALNSAETLIVATSITSIVGAFPSPIIGNGNGSTGNCNGITLFSYLSSTTPANRFNATANGTTTSDQNGAIVGSGVPAFLVYTFSPSTADALYDGAQPLTLFGGLSNTPLQSTGVYQLGGAVGGNCIGSITTMDGTIYFAGFLNRQIAANEESGIYAIVSDALNKMGVNVTSQNSGTNNTCAMIGDSLFSNGGLPTFMNFVSGFSCNFEVNAFAGMYSLIPLSAQPYSILPIVQNRGQTCLSYMWLGTDGVINANLSPASEWASQSAFVRGVPQPCKQILTTMISRTGTGFGGSTGDQLKNTFNGLVRSTWRQTGAAGLVDLASFPGVGADGANATSPPFISGDNIHLMNGALYNFAGVAVQNAMQMAAACQDFSCATTYSSAAAAAVATTAGSQTTNTITITMAATPANCQVGNTVHVAGTTPAGYSTSGSWSSMGPQILTRSATQITYYNDNSGLGAITVQGTVVCPQMQPQDVYSIVNFGAGNYTLLSCQGQTGQRRYIRNINGTPTTLVPDGSESITGAGAAPTTLAANTTAILESTLVSASAAGCNWVRLQ